MSKIKVGVMAPLEEGAVETLRKVHELGFSSCQVVCWTEELFTEENARTLRQTADELGIYIDSIWTGYPGRVVWDFVDGPVTIGVVPPELRATRVAALKKGADFARWAGVGSISTHVGFVPENLTDPVYGEVIDALREVAQYCAGNGLGFWFETGQETPVVLLRMIEDIGTDNLGVNLDPANLLMYGKANPIDALDIIGSYVRGVHAKDGEYPTGGRIIGKEKPLGEGRVNFPVFLRKLLDLGYQGALTIEREITGPQQILDIKQAKGYLESLLAELEG